MAFRNVVSTVCAGLLLTVAGRAAAQDATPAGSPTEAHHHLTAVHHTAAMDHLQALHHHASSHDTAHTPVDHDTVAERHLALRIDDGQPAFSQQWD